MGVVGGILARRIIPKMSADNAAFGLLIAVIGAMCGGFAAALFGLSSSIVPNLIIAFVGSMVVLFFYREYLSDAVS